MSRTSFAAGAVIVLALGTWGCEQGTQPAQPTKDTAAAAKSGASAKPKTAATGTAAPAKTGAPTKPAATATAKATGDPAPAKSDDPSVVPDIPTDSSKPPTVDEWKAAREVNTQGKGSWPKDCRMKVVREWLNVHCDGKVTGVKDMEGFGKKGQDYFEDIKPGKSADFVIKLRKGITLKLKILREDQNAALFVNWPAKADKPVNIALGIGKD